MSKIQKTKTKDQGAKTNKLQLKSRMQNLLMFLPNLVALCFRLLKDALVSTADKALFLGAIIYFISPIDFIPDVLPFIGQVDDTYFIALALLRLINHADEAVIHDNWKGGGDVIKLANSIASIAPMVLPKRVNRMLTARVELAPAAELMKAVKDRKTPVVRVISQNE
jgi:uncharacterized membrane protein YkvA (DUF1232 family)